MLLCLHLSDTTIWYTFTENKSIGLLDVWNSFLLSIILLNFNVFLLIFILRKKQKLVYFLMLLFYTEPFLDIVFLIVFNFIFLLLWQVLISLSCLFLYSFLVWFILLSNFFFRIISFCFLQDFLTIKSVIIHFYVLTQQLIKKIYFC